MPVSSAPEESALSLLEYSTRGISEAIVSDNWLMAIDDRFAVLQLLEPALNSTSQVWCTMYRLG